MPDPVTTLPDPSARLAAAYGAVAARMRDLNVYNPALEVEAVAFAPWEGAWLGVMLTPWFMNLALLPREPARWLPLATGAKRHYDFPAGRYEFVGAYDDAIGDFHVCSLFSPLHEFTDHPTARLVATLAREALFDAANVEAPEVNSAVLSLPAQAAGPGPLSRLEANLDAPMSKRDFLRARFTGGGDGDRG
jgi:[NiFe] hydrogenase assembly HybE family chaperone